MERRLQLLLDRDRYNRVAAEATRTGRSVSAVIRGAIDQAIPSGAVERAAAGKELLRLTEDPLPGPVQTWAEIKAEIEAEQIAHMDRVLGL